MATDGGGGAFKCDGHVGYACFATICVSQCFWSRVTISGAFLWPGPEHITKNGSAHKSLTERTK